MSSDVLQSFPSRRKYLAATMALIRFMRNKEDTAQAFRFFDATCGPRTEKNFARYAASPEGQQRIEENTNLAVILSDRDRLLALPPTTLGGAYQRFMDAEGLSAQGFVDIEREAGVDLLRLEPARRQFMTTGIQLHDIYHIILGYGRDFVGEACNLAFTATQLDLSFLTVLSKIVGVKEKLIYPHLPVFACIREAEEIGRNGVWTLDQDWNTLLDMELSEVRRTLNIPELDVYPKFSSTFEVVDAERREKLEQALAA